MEESDAPRAIAPFDYEARAELFMAGKRRAAKYLRFDRAADAIRFAIEDLPPRALLLTHIEIDDARISGREIRDLYDCDAFPLTRRPPSGLELEAAPEPEAAPRLRVTGAAPPSR
jgi:hypothetical protein